MLSRSFFRPFVSPGALLLAGLLVACSDDNNADPTGQVASTPPGSAGQSGASGAGAGGAGAGGAGAGGASVAGAAGSAGGNASVGGGSAVAGSPGTGGGAGVSGSTGGGAGKGNTAGSGGLGGAGGISNGGSAGAAMCSDPGCTEFQTPPGQGLPPDPTPGAGPGDGASDAIFAIRQLSLGESTPDGFSDPNAWKLYGFDLDGYSSTAAFPLHCKPQQGAKLKDIAVDGDGGIDNSYGKNIVSSIISALVMDPSKSASAGIELGNGTQVLRIQALGSGSDYTGLLGGLVRVQAQKNSQGQIIPPGSQWETGDYAWSPLIGQEMACAGHLSDNTLVMRSDKLALPFVMDGFLMGTSIHKAILSVKLDAGHTTGSEGQLGGLLDTEEYILGMKKVAGMLSSSFCDGGSAFDGIAQQIRQASDSLLDGGQDPTKTCNAISIGLGFELAAAQLGAPVPTPPEVDPCATP